MNWPSVVLLGIQALLAVVGLRVLVARVYPALGGRGDRAIVADVWGPIAVVAPLLVMAGRVGSSVRGAGWASIGAPACVGIIAVGVTLIAGRSGASLRAGGMRLPAGCAGAGVLLLLLGGAHDLTVWIGQCTFALGAVLLWMNTPSPSAASAADEGHATGPRLAVWPLPAVLACAAGQGACGLLVTEPAHVAVSIAMMVAYAASAVAGAAALGAAPGGGGPWALRIGGWAAALGTLFGIGILSLVHMTPQALRVLVGGQQVVQTNVAGGFGAFAIEGVLMLLVATALPALDRVPGSMRAPLGATAACLGAILAAWRVAKM